MYYYNGIKQMGNNQSEFRDNIYTASLDTTVETGKHRTELSYGKKLGDVIQYFDNNIWSIGVVFAITFNGVMINDVFTRKTSSFYADSQAINTNLIHPNAIRRLKNGTPSLCFVLTGQHRYKEGEILVKYTYGSYVDLCGHRPHKKYVKMCKYRAKNIKPINSYDIHSIGKRVKLFFAHRYADRTLCTYIHGIIYGIMSDGVIISGWRGVHLCIPKIYFNQIYEMDDDDTIITVGSSVIYNGKNYVVADVRNDTIKLSGCDIYIEKNQVELFTLRETLDNLAGSNPTLELNQYFSSTRWIE